MSRAALHVLFAALTGFAGCVPEATLVTASGGAAGRSTLMQQPGPLVAGGCGTLNRGPPCTTLDGGVIPDAAVPPDSAVADGGLEPSEAVRVPREGEWVLHLGSESSDQAAAVSTDTESNILVAGVAGGALTSAPDGGVADGGAFIAKYDASGNALWLRQFAARAAAVSTDSSGNVYVAGETSEALPEQTSLGGDDAFLRKYDAAGTELWTRQFGSDAPDQTYAMSTDASGNVYVAGSVGGALPDETSFGGADAFLRKYDANGAVLWTEQFGTAGDDNALALSVDGAGNVVIAGIGEGVLAGQIAAEPDGFVRKYAADGVALWTQQLGVEDVTSARADANGSVYVAGYTRAQLTEQVSSGSDDAFVRKYDAAGTALWTRQFGTTRIDQATAVTVDRAGQVIVGGRTLGTPLGLGYFGGDDVFIRAYTGSGEERWTDRFGSTGADRLRALVVDASGSLLAVGSTGGVLPGQRSLGGSDAFVMKVIE